MEKLGNKYIFLCMLFIYQQLMDKQKLIREIMTIFFEWL